MKTVNLTRAVYLETPLKSQQLKINSRGRTERELHREQSWHGRGYNGKIKATSPGGRVNVPCSVQAQFQKEV
jgi:hypothetical protein